MISFIKSQVYFITKPVFFCYAFRFFFESDMPLFLEAANSLKLARKLGLIYYISEWILIQSFRVPRITIWLYVLLGQPLCSAWFGSF